MTDLPVRVVGAGPLLPALRATFSNPGSDPAELIVSVGQAAPSPAATPVLAVRAERGRVAVGPMVTAGVPGCDRCADSRRRRAADDPRVLDLLREPAPAAASWLTALAADAVAAVVLDEATRQLVPGTGPPRTRGAMLFVELADLTVERSAFIPDPACPVCAPPPVPAAAPELTGQPKRSPTAYRLRPAAAELDRLRASYVTGPAGLIRLSAPVAAGGMVTTEAIAAIGESDSISGFGHHRDAVASAAAAIFEAMERFGGMAAGRPTGAIRAGYREVADRAVPPELFGLYPADRYTELDFPYQPFTEQLELGWVPGYSFGEQRTVLIPESLAYYRLRRGPLLALTASSGCAVGANVTEAILHALVEVAERDAFLLAWHTRLTVPRIRLDARADPAAAAAIEALQARTGYRVELFDITVDTGVPSIWAVARTDQPGHPSVVCTAAAHLDPGAAVVKAAGELAMLIPLVTADYETRRWRIPLMVERPAYVRRMADHGLLFADPDIARRLDHLGADGAEVELAKVGGLPLIRHADLRDDLLEVIDRFAAAGLDVIVVDQTTAEHRAADLACVRVLAPGTLPMTFGHDNRRLHGLPRLLSVPALLGRRMSPLSAAEIDHHPHPMP
ncbi:hypothetical protein GCM10023191_030570 [Actinoallomurus oryzae]|uniref:YcaO domain-containing protein n=1 Tax=Actinoallomurus oryzae TaxID=502180 RepID=A0ABP8PV35_9ACTN